MSEGKYVYVVVFATLTGKRVALDRDTIEGIVEEDDGCTIVTSHDTHRVAATFDEACAEVWRNGDRSKPE